jgi:hypothetical protein
LGGDTQHPNHGRHQQEIQRARAEGTSGVFHLSLGFTAVSSTTTTVSEMLLVHIFTPEIMAF